MKPATKTTAFNYFFLHIKSITHNGCVLLKKRRNCNWFYFRISGVCLTRLFSSANICQEGLSYVYTWQDYAKLRHSRFINLTDFLVVFSSSLPCCPQHEVRVFAVPLQYLTALETHNRVKSHVRLPRPRFWEIFLWRLWVPERFLDKVIQNPSLVSLLAWFSDQKRFAARWGATQRELQEFCVGLQSWKLFHIEHSTASTHTNVFSHQ